MRIPTTIQLALVICVAALAPAASAQNVLNFKKSITLYASFDEAVKADLGDGELTLSTRFNHPTEKDQFIFKKGFDANVFKITRNGIHGGALQPVDVLPDNGRIFFPAKGNLHYDPEGWSGAVSMWINTDPNKLLKTRFCDPVQITQKGANNGGIWFDFNDARPRDLRMGLFPAAKAGQKPLSEADADAPLVSVKAISFKEGDWHHVVITWKNLDTGRNNARARLFIDGKLMGELGDRALAMNWDLDKTGIYVAVNFIGLLDEFAVFNRALTEEDVQMLRQKPGLLSSLKE